MRGDTVRGDIVGCVIVMFVVVELLRFMVFFFFQAEDGIRDLVRSRGLGDVYKRQVHKDGAVIDCHCLDAFRQIAVDFDHFLVDRS